MVYVDSGSTDQSVGNAREHGAEVLQTAGRQGPAAARNLGAARAGGDILLFVDADCSVAPETLDQILEVFSREPDLDALFGSYDDSPSAAGLIARYKNLQHHYVHQQGAEEATTFWAGCGAIRKRVFESLGGFDTRRYERPSIEDIELGYRLRRAGGRIRLAKQVQVTHHKAWTLGGVLRSDLLDRGIPWTLLILESQPAEAALNVDARGRWSVVLAALVVLGLVAAPFWPWALALCLVSAGLLVWLHAGFYRLLFRNGGAGLLMVGLVMHGLYHLNCGLAYGIGRLRHGLGDR